MSFLPRHWILTLLAGCGMLLPGGKLHAVQVYGPSGTGSTYTTAPADDFGFANVARVFDSWNGFYTSGVYLGNGWMLSAYHEVRLDDSGSGGFSFGNVVLNGSNYSVNAVTAVRITDPVTHDPVDLAMYRLTTVPSDPALRTLVIPGSTPAAATALTLMGNGLNRLDTPTYWDVNKVPSPWTWTVTSTTSGPNIYSGYGYGSGLSLRWGTGAVDGTDVINDGFGLTSVLYSLFQDSPGSAIAAIGDSGGGVFYKSGATWILCGIMLTIGTPDLPYSGQPDNTSVVGDMTFAANLAAYSSQINALALVQEPSINSQPNNLTIAETGTGLFSVAAAGVPTPGYQWQRLPAGSGTWSNLTNVAGTYAGTSTATLTLSNALMAMNGDQFRCVVSNGYPPDVTSNPATLSVVNGYNAWALSWFGAQYGNSAISGPTATPQNDGISNALKYLTDINPTIPMSAASVAALPVGGVVTTGGTQYLTLTYRRDPNVTGLTLAVQTCTDMHTWQSVTPDSTQTIGTDPATGDPIIQIKISSSGQALFARFEITVS